MWRVCSVWKKKLKSEFCSIDSRKHIPAVFGEYRSNRTHVSKINLKEKLHFETETGKKLSNYNSNRIESTMPKWIWWRTSELKCDAVLTSNTIERSATGKIATDGYASLQMFVPLLLVASPYAVTTCKVKRFVTVKNHAFDAPPVSLGLLTLSLMVNLYTNWSRKNTTNTIRSLHRSVI